VGYRFAVARTFFPIAYRGERAITKENNGRQGTREEQHRDQVRQHTEAKADPLAVLDIDLRPIAANPQFHEVFGTTPQTLGPAIAAIFESLERQGRDLRQRVRQMIASSAGSERIQWPDARGAERSLVLAPASTWRGAERGDLIFMEDVTERLLAERQLSDRVEHNEVMVEELKHRMANSLQIIASIARIKSHLVQSAEGRHQLEDVHERVLSIAELQEQLDAARQGRAGSIAGYLSNVCRRLETSLVDPTSGIELRVDAADVVMPPDECVSIGLLVTELVINAVKHGFQDRQAGVVDVRFDVRPTGWILSVTDNGSGCSPDGGTKPGVGTHIVRTLARRLGAELEVSRTDPHGVTVTVSHRGAPLESEERPQ
jgi:chemotaxis protein methyltransferase CheR